ncbi:MAG: hypothetical protein KC426_03350 [Oceanospirillaceae bacterium]|nr:hypothetical protein [Oceanospirillaceae bacterium]
MLATMRLEPSNPFTPLGVLGEDGLSDEEARINPYKVFIKVAKNTILTLLYDDLPHVNAKTLK